MRKELRGKRILVTGGCGTIGAELVRQLLSTEYTPQEVIVADNHEASLFEHQTAYAYYDCLNYVLCDIRDEEKIRRLALGIDIVFHTAALKHVTFCESSPFDAVQTNIIGVKNIISAALENHVRRVVFTSSDKAVNPTNVMGASKLMGERLISAANCYRNASHTIFASVRFGNVLGSNGSVVPLFHNQIRNGGPVTLTDPLMTRFIMTVQQAVELIVDAAFQAKGGEIFITKMPAAKIEDLAYVMIEGLSYNYGYRADEIELQVTGAKPGEKIYEELMTEEEKRHSKELEKYFVVLPALRSFYKNIRYEYDDIISNEIEKAYNSMNESHLTRRELKDFLDCSGLLETTDKRIMDGVTQRVWPGEKS